MHHSLFVYGTLRPGESNAHHLADIKGEWQPAHVRGQFYASGWGEAKGFPGLILDPLGERVDGLVLTSAELAAHWDRLDTFEGPGYERVQTRVTLEDGQTMRAHIYELADKVPPA